MSGEESFLKKKKTWMKYFETILCIMLHTFKTLSAKNALFNTSTQDSIAIVDLSARTFLQNVRTCSLFKYKISSSSDKRFHQLFRYKIRLVFTFLSWQFSETSTRLWGDEEFSTLQPVPTDEMMKAYRESIRIYMGTVLTVYITSFHQF